MINSGTFGSITNSPQREKCRCREKITEDGSGSREILPEGSIPAPSSSDHAVPAAQKCAVRGRRTDRVACACPSSTPGQESADLPPRAPVRAMPRLGPKPMIRLGTEKPPATGAGEYQGGITPESRIAGGSAVMKGRLPAFNPPARRQRAFGGYARGSVPTDSIGTAHPPTTSIYGGQWAYHADCRGETSVADGHVRIVSVLPHLQGGASAHNHGKQKKSNFSHGSVACVCAPGGNSCR